MRIVHNIISVVDQVWIHATDPPCDLNSQDYIDVRVGFEADLALKRVELLCRSGKRCGGTACRCQFSNLLTYTLNLAHNVKPKS